VSQIPNFWPLVLEQAPPDIDQYIQPSDSALLLSSLTSLSVSHFEILEGDPRSIAIKWDFAENEYFEDSVLEKKFWHRRGRDGWTGLVSEPVSIKWKKGKDLTGGLLDMVCKAWDVELKESNHTNSGSDGDSTKHQGLSAEQGVLKKKIDNTGMGGLSFFAWFGFIGRKIGAEESKLATQREAERRILMKSGQKLDSIMDDDDVEEEDEAGMSLEIFPDGDDLAVAITEDLWPGAIKYFTQAQEQDALSDADFESDDEEQDDTPKDAEEESDNGRPSKKRRS
jgi:hypothetical protein